MSREYKKRKRAESEAETRQRIAAAAAELHEELGPARTTFSAVAERAGVQRATLYRHFPSEEALFEACSAHWGSHHPPPDPTPWHAIADPDERLRTVLLEIYGWYEGVEPMLEMLYRDISVVPSVAHQMDQTAVPYLSHVADLLATGRPRRKSTRAAIGHALGFDTWRSLVRAQGLSNTQAADLMTALVSSA